MHIWVGRADAEAGARGAHERTGTLRESLTRGDARTEIRQQEKENA